MKDMLTPKGKSFNCTVSVYVWAIMHSQFPRSKQVHTLYIVLYVKGTIYAFLSTFSYSNMNMCTCTSLKFSSPGSTIETK